MYKRQVGYYQNGSKEREMNLSNGNGDFTQYYENGKVKVKGSIRNNKAYGNWTFYSQDGYVTSTQSFY